MIELAVLVLILGILLILVHTKIFQIEGFTDTEEKTEEKTEEGFVTSEDNDYHLSACPSGFKTFYDSNGNLTCCDGEIVGNKCLTGKQCTLTSSAGSSPTCASLLHEMYLEKGKSFCPPSMPNYYEDSDNNKKGCTAGRLLPTMNGPRTTSQPTCIMYGTLEENLTAKDSCHNYKKMEEFPCFGVDCRKEIVQPKADAPSLIAVHFTDSAGMFHISYTRESMENYMNLTKPRWRDQGLDLEKNIHVAEVAKAYYVDKTIKDIQI